MPAYLISGPSGSGKSYVGRELKNRGYRVIETDFEPGLSSWVHKETREKIVDLPPHPYSKGWLDTHEWVWDADQLKKLTEGSGKKPVFFVGGAHNEKDFIDLFDKRFSLTVDSQILTSRLQPREPKRWVEGSAELQQQIDWNLRAKDYYQSIGAIVIDSSSSVEKVADNILSHIV